MASTNQFRINGVVDTSQNVLDNIVELADASGVFITWDSNAGKWTGVINDVGTSVHSFDNSNILGSITLSTSDIDSIYNIVNVQFPHKDLLDRTDIITYSIPSAQRFDGESDNALNINLAVVNDPVQAQLIAARELKQSRVDKSIKFRTDFTGNGLLAGQLVDITNTAYGWNSKLFRIISIEEQDGDDGSLVFAITALEYDSAVYSTAGLVREERNNRTGIVPKNKNSAVIASENRAGLPLDVSEYARQQGLQLGYNQQTGRYELSQGSRVVPLTGANNIVINWTFSTGEDLDIRCRIVSPDVGQNTIDDVVGYTGGDGSQFPPESNRYWPTTGTPILSWGGDNTGTGQESVLLDLNAFKAAYPSAQYVIVECRGNFYSTLASTPVQLTSTLYRDGTPTLSGFTFANSTATTSRALDSNGIFIESNFGNPVEGQELNGSNAPGDLMGYLVFDTVAEEGQFVFDLSPYGI
jgi:hypothetical protein